MDRGHYLFGYWINFSRNLGRCFELFGYSRIMDMNFIWRSFHWLMFFPNDIFSYDIFSQDNFSYWHFFPKTFFPKTFFPIKHFFLVTFFPCDIFSQVLFFPKWHFFLILGYFFLFIFPKNFMRKVLQNIPSLILQII